MKNAEIFNRLLHNLLIIHSDFSPLKLKIFIRILHDKKLPVVGVHAVIFRIKNPIFDVLCC